MKKIFLAIVLIFCLCFLAVSCGDSTTDKGDESTKNTKNPSINSEVADSGINGSTDSSSDTSVSDDIDSSDSGNATDSGATSTDSSTNTTDSSITSTDSSATTTGSSASSSDSSDSTSDSSVPSSDPSTDSSTDTTDTGITTDSSEPTTDSSEPTTDSSEPTTDSSEPTTDSSEPTTDSSEPTTDSSKEDEDDKPIPHIHEFGDFITVLEPTCTENGEREKRCSCGLVIAEEVSKLGHSYGKPIILRNPTCSVPGEEKQICPYCRDEILNEIPTLPHSLNVTGSCENCDYYSAEDAIVIAIDISSSMKEILGSVSRFTALLNSLTESLLSLPEDTVVSIVAFDGELHNILEPQFLPADGRDAIIEQIEYTILHSYYYYYLDSNGIETDIPVRYDDGDQYTNLGYKIPERGTMNGGYDRVNYYTIKTYGTAYNPPITYAKATLESLKANKKSLIFISDGNPSDIGSGYQETIAEMADNGIFTSTICLGYNSYSNMQELALVSQNGKGASFAVDSQLTLQLSMVSLLGSELNSVTDENGFIFLSLDGEYYLIGYEGNASDVILPELFNGEVYEIASNAFNNLQFMHSITFPSTVTSIPSYAVSDCQHLYTVRFLADSTRINSNAFVRCIRLYESFGTITGSSVKQGEGGPFYQHRAPDEESYIKITEDGFVFAVLYSSGIIDFIDYIGEETDIRVDVPDEIVDILHGRIRSAYVNWYALYGSDVEKAVFSDKFSNVYSYAFASCSSLKEVVFEGDIYLSNRKIFEGSPNVEFLAASAHTNSSASDLLSYSPNMIILWSKETVTSEPFVVVGATSYGITDDGFKWVASSAFGGVVILNYYGEDEKVKVPNEIDSVPVVAIYDEAFAGCSFITSMSIPSTITHIGADAFLGCDAIFRTIGGISYVGNWIVDCDDTITETTALSNTVGVASKAFASLPNLVFVQLHTSVIYICENAFVDCDGATILFRHQSALDTWEDGWNPDGVPVVFGACSVHSWVAANCTTPKHCITCSVFVGDVYHASANEATCTEPSVCALCQTVVQNALGHTTEDGISCSRCGVSLSSHLITLEDIESLTASHTGGGAPYLEYLFDGDKTSGGIYNNTGKEYFAEAVGDYFTIVLKKEECVTGISFWGMGNWTQMTVELYDEDGNLVGSNLFNYNTSISAGDSACYSVRNDGEGVGISSDIVKVKTIIGRVTGIKWSDGRTNKTSEVEIFVLREE